MRSLLGVWWRMLLVFALLQPRTAAGQTAARPSAGAYEDPSTWERIEFGRSEDLIVLLERHRFGPAFWAQGERTVPRIYLADIPARWGQYQASHLTVQRKKMTFFYVLGPTVLAANEKVARERRELERLLALRRTGTTWTPTQSAWLAGLRTRYAVADGLALDAALEELLVRVDIVPASLVLAQAANESGWGTSRFASQGNALFGQWTYRGDGITPAQQRTATMGNYQVRAFATPMDAVSGYLLNLNTNRSYAELRRLRRQMRVAGRRLSGLELAAGLIRYSERGQAYVDDVRALIRFNNLQEADLATLREMRPILLVPVGEDVR